MKHKFRITRENWWDIKDGTWGIGAYIHRPNKKELYLLIELFNYIWFIGWHDRGVDDV